MPSITHRFQSTIPDSPDNTLVQPSNWNDSHAVPVDGVVVGSNSDNIIGVSAMFPLQYLRRTNVTTTSGYEFVDEPYLRSTDFDWSQQIPNTLSAGATSVTLSPVPLGVNGSNTNFYIRFEGVTPEVRLVTGGTAVSGAASGTLTFSALSNTHTGPFTVRSATAGIREAILYDAPANVFVPPGNHILYSNLTITGRGGSDCNVFGSGTIASRLVRHSSYANGDLVTVSTVTAEGRVNLSNLSILNASGFENSSGSGLLLIPTQLDSVNCYRVEVLNGYNPVRIDPFTVTGRVTLNDCRAIILLNYSSLYATGDAIICSGSSYIVNTIGEIQGPNATHGAGLKVTSCDGLNVIGGAYMGKHCILIEADPAKILNFCYFDNLILDSAFSHCFYVAPGAHNLVYSQVRLQNSQLATQSGDPNGIGVYIANDLQSFVLSGCNISGFSNSGVVIGASGIYPKGWVISSNCINNSGNYGVVVSSGSADAIGVISGNQIGNAIDAYGAPTQEVGVYFVGSTGKYGRISVSGNNLHGNTVLPIAFDAGPTNQVVWTGNSGVDEVVTSVVPSASSIALPVFPVFGLTGTTGVGTITGPLAEGHQWTMVPTGVVTFTAGPTIGNTFTTVANVPVELTVYGGKVYLK